MAQIILLDQGKPPASRILRNALRTILLLLLGIIVFDAISTSLGRGGQITAMLNVYLWPYLRWPLALAGLPQTPAENSQLTALGSLFMVLFIRPFLLLLDYGRAARKDCRTQMGETAKSTAVHDKRFLTALALGVLALIWRAYPLEGGTGIDRNVFQLLRLAGLMTLLTGMIVNLLVGFHARRCWLALHPPAPATARAPKKAGKEAAVVIPMPPGKPTDRAFLVALAAELVQFCGTENRAPRADELAERLAPLLRAADLTRSNPVGPGQLATLCEKALTIFSRKKLRSLKDIKAARTLYNTPRPGAIDAIVNELSGQLKMF